MTKTDIETRYSNFLKVHSNSISLELQVKYHETRGSFHFDFGGKVCIPLFVLWALVLFLFPRPVNNLILFIISAIFISFAIWLNHFKESIVDTICCYYFRKYEYNAILLRYVRQCKNGTLRDASSESEINDIECVFSFYENHITEEYFQYT